MLWLERYLHYFSISLLKLIEEQCALPLSFVFHFFFLSALFLLSLFVTGPCTAIWETTFAALGYLHLKSVCSWISCVVFVAFRIHFFIMVTIKYRDTKVYINLRHWANTFIMEERLGETRNWLGLEPTQATAKLMRFPVLFLQESLCSFYLPFLLRRTVGEKMRERQKEGRTLATLVNIRRETA